MSVIVTWVLLNVARMFAMPTVIFFACLALMIFLPALSSPSSSAAVGAVAATGPVGAAGAAASLGLPASAGAPAAAGFFDFSSVGLADLSAPAAPGFAS